MPAEPVIVTLDGPAGVGKTTLAKQVAQQLGVAYLDTGAMFRASALMLGPGSWELPDDKIAKAMDALSFSLQGSGATTKLLVDSRPLGDEIRTEQVGMWASNLAVRPVLRERLKAAQQALGAHTSLVAEGRDMGTVVFPNAKHKFFLDADPAERARRRYEQLKAMGKSADLNAIEQSIRERDEQDRNRATAPLVPAKDALTIDTTHLDIQGVFTRIIQAIPDAV